MQALWNAPLYADTRIVYRDSTADALTLNRGPKN